MFLLYNLLLYKLNVLCGVYLVRVRFPARARLDLVEYEIAYTTGPPAGSVFFTLTLIKDNAVALSTFRLP